MENAGKGERLQCLLARAGVDSRRHCASIIAGGAVSVNGKIVREPGLRLSPEQTCDIRVNGRRIFPVGAQQAPRIRVVAMNKPRGLLCTKAEGTGRTVYELLGGIPERLVSAGRLDRDSEGLLILTNDGALVNRLTHPRYGHEKTYRVVACGLFSDETLDTLQGPLQLDGIALAPVRVEYLRRLRDSPTGEGRHALVFRLREGRNRQIRRMCEIAALRVESLKRTAINAFTLPKELKPGEWRDVTAAELALLEKVPSSPLKPWRVGEKTS